MIAIVGKFEMLRDELIKKKPREWSSAVMTLLDPGYNFCGASSCSSIKSAFSHPPSAPCLICILSPPAPGLNLHSLTPPSSWLCSLPPRSFTPICFLSPLHKNVHVLLAPAHELGACISAQ